jgi:hypothetical protein
MKKFRIVSNGKVFRVQRRVKLWFMRYWSDDKYYEVNDTYPKLITHKVEFPTFEEADAYVKSRIQDVNEHKKWRVVKKFN